MCGNKEKYKNKNKKGWLKIIIKKDITVTKTINNTDIRSSTPCLGSHYRTHLIQIPTAQLLLING